MTDGWIEVSVPLKSGMLHWPGDPEVVIERFSDMRDGAAANLTHLNMGAHTGTHVDAPLHFLSGGVSVDMMPPSAMFGIARLLDFPEASAISAANLRPFGIGRGERILFKTRNSGRRWSEEPFDHDFAHLTVDAAVYLAARELALVGFDYLSVAGYERNESEVHEALLSSGVWILEGLDLSELAPGRYEFVCLPLRIAGADGAPARALARPLPEE